MTITDAKEIKVGDVVRWPNGKTVVYHEHSWFSCWTAELLAVGAITVTREEPLPEPVTMWLGSKVELVEVPESLRGHATSVTFTPTRRLENA